MSSLIAGKRIAFTGAFYNMSRKQATEKAVAAGAIVSPQFNQNCDLLVTGGGASENSTKSAKAQQAGTQVIAEADFFQALGMPVPQYDPTEFVSSSRRGGPRGPRTPKVDFTGKFGVSSAQRNPAQVPSPIAPTTAVAQAEASVQADGTLNEQIPTAPTVPNVVVPEVIPQSTPSVSRKPRTPRSERTPLPVSSAPVAPVEMTADGTILLTGKTVVFTGRLSNLNRLTAATLVHRMGGHVSSTIGGKTDLLVCGGGEVSLKREKAASKGIPTISEDDFVAACAATNQQAAVPQQPTAVPQQQAAVPKAE